MSRRAAKKIHYTDMERALETKVQELRRQLEEIQLYSEEEELTFYNPPTNIATKPLNNKSLAKVLERLPIDAKPGNESNNNRYNKNKLKNYLGPVSDRQFKYLTKTCSPDHLKCGKEVTMSSYDGDRSNLMNCAPLQKGGANSTGLNILEKNKSKLAEKGSSATYLKHQNVHVHNEQQGQNRSSNPTVSSEPKNTGKTSKKSARNKNTCNNLPCKSSAYAFSQTYADLGVGMDDCGPSSKFTPHQSDSYIPQRHRNELLYPGKDILMKIRIYKPFDYEDFRNKTEDEKNEYDLFYQDMILTSRHKISDIKLNVFCNENLHNNKSENFLFIMNAYYVNQDPETLMQADALREWCSPRESRNFPKFDMDMRLDQLNYRVVNPDVVGQSCEWPPWVVPPQCHLPSLPTW